MNIKINTENEINLSIPLNNCKMRYILNFVSFSNVIVTPT